MAGSVFHGYPTPFLNSTCLDSWWPLAFLFEVSSSSAAAWQKEAVRCLHPHASSTRSHKGPELPIQTAGLQNQNHHQCHPMYHPWHPGWLPQCFHTGYVGKTPRLPWRPLCFCSCAGTALPNIWDQPVARDRHCLLHRTIDWSVSSLRISFRASKRN